MIKKIWFFSCLIFVVSLGCGNQKKVSIENQETIIVIGSNADEKINLAAVDFQHHVKMATGELLRIFKDKEPLPKNCRVVLIGSSLLTKGFAQDDLAEDEFILKGNSDTLAVLGNPSSKLSSTHYGVNHLLEILFEVKWIYPGVAGTDFLSKKQWELPELDIVWKPQMQMRIFHHGSNLDDSTRLWLIHHRIGAIDTLSLGHGFKDYYPDLLPYLSRKPSYFGGSLDSEKQEYREKQVKFRFNDPGFRKAVVQRWYTNGQPEIFNLSLPDGSGYDASTVPEADARELWNGRVNVTAPYLDFCQDVERVINSDKRNARCFIFSYGAYHMMPEDYSFDGKNFIVSYVSKSLDSLDRRNWMLWNNSGAEMILRPNWWVRGYFTPLAPYERQSKFFEFARSNGMQGMNIGDLKRNWSMQGFQYYLIARMSYTDLTYEEVKMEYLNFFGPYKNGISQYLELGEELYWQKLVDENGKHRNELYKITPSRGNYQDLEKKIGSADLLTLNNALAKYQGKDVGKKYDRRFQWFLSGNTLMNELLKYYKRNEKEPSKELTKDIIDRIRGLEKKFPYSYNPDHIVNRYVLKYNYSEYSRKEYLEDYKGLKNKTD